MEDCAARRSGAPGDHMGRLRQAVNWYKSCDLREESQMAYEVPDLPYDYAALEPHYSAHALELHHDKHHAAYVKQANAALEELVGAASG